VIGRDRGTGKQGPAVGGGDCEDDGFGQPEGPHFRIGLRRNHLVPLHIGSKFVVGGQNKSGEEGCNFDTDRNRNQATRNETLSEKRDLLSHTSRSRNTPPPVPHSVL